MSASNNRFRRWRLFLRALTPHKTGRESRPAPGKSDRAICRRQTLIIGDGDDMLHKSHDPPAHNFGTGANSGPVDALGTNAAKVFRIARTALPYENAEHRRCKPGHRESPSLSCISLSHNGHRAWPFRTSDKSHRAHSSAIWPARRILDIGDGGIPAHSRLRNISAPYTREKSCTLFAHSDHRMKNGKPSSCFRKHFSLQASPCS